MNEGARAATEADVERIVELARVLHDELAALRGGAVWAAHDGREPDRDAYAALVADTAAHAVAVGTIDGTVIGYATADVQTLRDGTKLGVVRELFVESEARAVGVGEALLTEVTSRLEGLGCRAMDAYALPGHRAAKNFFEEQGMTARLLVMHRPIP